MLSLCNSNSEESLLCMSSFVTHAAAYLYTRLYLSCIGAFGARNKVMRGLEALLTAPAQAELTVSPHTSEGHEFLCPITHEVMVDPVVASGV